MGLFDCCREEVSSNDDRGTGGNHGGMNLILSFGCPPSSTTPKKSTIAVDYFEHLKLKANQQDGTVILPDALLDWQGTDGMAETLPKFKQHLKLAHSNWTQVQENSAIPSVSNDMEKLKMQHEKMKNEIEKSKMQQEMEKLKMQLEMA